MQPREGVGADLECGWEMVRSGVLAVGLVKSAVLLCELVLALFSAQHCLLTSGKILCIFFICLLQGGVCRRGWWMCFGEHWQRVLGTC